MGTKTFTGYSCDRCDHEWVPRIIVDEKPALCPKCKSAYWDRPTRMELAKKQATMKHFKGKKK